MKRFFRILGRFLIFAAILWVVGYYIHDYTQREYWVYIDKDCPPASGITLTLDRRVYDKKHFIITYTLSNTTKNDVTWGAELGGRVEQWTEDGWRYRERRMRKGAAYPAVGYYLEAGTSVTGEVSLHAALPRLAPGRYRYARYLGSFYDRCIVYQEFTIE